MPTLRQKVIGYGRVSTEEQENNYSLDAQRSRFEHLCKQNHRQSLGFFPETGSGTSVINRPVLCNILQRIQQGGVDALWVKETDRLSRPENLGDLSLISQTLESTNTLLIVDSRILDLREDNSVLMLDFEGVLAKHFRRQLLRNMNRGKIRKAELGRKAGGADVFGYRTNEKGQYAPEPEEAKVVQLVYELYAKDFTLRQMKAELKKRGIRTRRGCEWSICMLGIMLKNDVYLGVYRFHKSKHGKDVDGSWYMVRREDNIIVGSREKPNHSPIVDAVTFDVVQTKIAANRHKTSSGLYMATGLLQCPVCSAPMHARYSSASYKHHLTVVKYACSKKPNCTSRRMLVSETNDLLWHALVELFIQPERIHSLLTPSAEDDLESLKKQCAAIEKHKKLNKEKLDRLLNLYLEGNIPQASYVVKSSELEAEAERLAQNRSELQRRIQNHGKQDARAELIQTIRLLSRSHRRFTEEQRVKVFRSLIKETRITANGVEFEMYVQPTRNVWWKYRQKSAHKQDSRQGQTVRVGIPQSARPEPSIYTTSQAAKILGISSGLLRLRIKVGKYPAPPRVNGQRPLFTTEHVQQMRSMR
jgi:site-specific DNA recombinase